MALQVWLPLNGDLHNQGLSKVSTVNNGATVNNNGKIGKCYSFNGSSYIDTGYTESFGTGDFTICCWIYLTQTSGKTYQCIIGNKGTGAASVGVSLYYNQNQKKFLWSTADGSNATEIWSVDTFDTVIFNQWHHIAMVRNNNDAKKGYFYFDGVRKEIASVPAIRNVTSTVSLKVGSVTPVYAAYHYTGQVNDVRIYDHALSKKEIEEISKGLVLHYQLNNGNPNLLSEYVAPGSGTPGVTSTGGRTNYYGKYGIIIPATENADTYFRLFLKQQLVQGTTYTISCYVSGLLPGSYYNFPLFAQGNTSMGILQLNHNGLCSLTFTMNSSSQSAVTTPEGDTVYVCFMDDAGRTLASGQGAIIINGFKLEQGNNVTNFFSIDNNIIYDASGYNNNGTIVGEMTIHNSSPKYNNSIKQANGQYIRVNNQPAACMPKDAITVNLWQYATSWSNPISCTEGGGWNFENSNGIRFPVYISGVGYKVAQSSITTAQTLNAWHMLTGTMDKDNIKIYYDGEEVGAVTNGSTNGIGYANNYIFIGAEAQGNNTAPAGSGYTGGIGDVRIYATALTPAQIKELYETSKIVDGTTIKARDLEVSA